MMAPPPPKKPPSSSSSSSSSSASSAGVASAASSAEKEREKRERRRIRMEKMARKAERQVQQQQAQQQAQQQQNQQQPAAARVSTAPTPTAAASGTSKGNGNGGGGGGGTAKKGGGGDVQRWPESSSESLPPLSGQVARGIVDGGMEFAVNDECTSLKLAPSGRHVVAGFTDGTLRLFDLTGRLWSPVGDEDSDDEHGLFDDESSSEEEEEEDGGSSGSGTGGDFKRSPSVEEEMRQLFDSSEDEGDYSAARGTGGGIATPRGSSKKPSPRSSSIKSGAYAVSVSSSGPSGRAATTTATVGTTAEKGMVCSKYHQRYGAVACQIHARGVITSLLMDVSIAQDGLYAFGGVLRGSMELVAVDLSGVELYHDSRLLGGRKDTRAESGRDADVDMLDLIHVYRHSDAKLKGFGACTRLNRMSGGGGVEYRLFTGKGIKNIHIWSFIPPNATRSEPLWQCLYDTPTNGNTINFLHFRHDANGLLQGISKSDDQKLRVWDLSCEQYAVQGEEEDKNTLNTNRKQSVIKQLRKAGKKLLQGADKTQQRPEGRPKRPPYVDVTSTESALGVVGPYAFSGGSDMYNQMSVVCLDVEDVTTPYNHTELALPGQGGDSSFESPMGRRSRSGRQQRGDLKSIVSVAGLEFDAGHVLLELSDGSLVHYTQNSAQAHLELLSPDLYKTSEELEYGPDANEGESGGVRRMCVSRVGSEGTAILATSTYNSMTGKGTMMLKHIGASSPRDKKASGFWGFHGASALSFPKSFIKKDSRTADAFDRKAKIDKMPISPDASSASSKALVTPQQTRRKETERPRSADIVMKPAEAIVTPSSRTTRGKKGASSTVSPTGLPWEESGIVSSGVTISPEQKEDGSKQGTKVAPKTKTKSGAMAKYLKGSASKERSAQRSKKGPTVAQKTSKAPKNDEARGRTKEQQNSNLAFLCDVATGQIKSPKTARKTPEASPTKMKKNQRTTRSSSPPRWRNSAKSINDSAASHHRHKRPRMNNLPLDTVTERMDVSRATMPPASAHASSSSSVDNITNQHEYERRRLAAEHRAWHEMLKKKLLTCTERQIRAWNMQSSNSSGNSPSYEKVRAWIDDTVSSHQDMLIDILDRQRLEASSMAAMQTAENGGKQAAELQVSFPFPEIFTQVKDRVMGHFSHTT